MSRDVPRLIVVGGVIALVGLLAAVSAPGVSLEAIEQVLPVNPLLVALLAAALAAFVVSQALAMARGGVAARSAGRTSALDLGWTLAPLLLVAGVSFYTISSAGDALASPVLVEVRQDAGGWQFHYPQHGVTADELVVPRGGATRISVASVLVPAEAFSIPTLGVAFPPRGGGSVALLPHDSGTFELLLPPEEQAAAGRPARGSAHLRVVDRAGFTRWLEQERTGQGDQ